MVCVEDHLAGQRLELIQERRFQVLGPEVLDKHLDTSGPAWLNVDTMRPGSFGHTARKQCRIQGWTGPREYETCDRP